MADVVITDTLAATDGGGWVGDDLNGERLAVTDAVAHDAEFQPFHTRTIGDTFGVADGGAWESPGQGEQLGLTDQAGVEARNLTATVGDTLGVSDQVATDTGFPVVFVRSITDGLHPTDGGSFFVGTPPEILGVSDAVSTGGVVTVRVVGDSLHLTDASDPLSYLYGLTVTESALSLDDAVAEPETTAPLNYVRTVGDTLRATDTLREAADVALDTSDTLAASDEVVYRLRGRVSTPPKRTFIVQPELRTLLIAAPRRRFPS